MYKQSAARKCEQAKPSTPATEQTPQTQATTVITNTNSNSPSSPSSPSVSTNADGALPSPSLSTSETTPNELIAIGNASASYIAPPSQPRTEVQTDLCFARKIRQLELKRKQYDDGDEKSDVLVLPESESSSAYASGKGVHWFGLPEELAELYVGTEEALRREVRRRRVMHR
jgi:hypothetical protein